MKQIACNKMVWGRGSSQKSKRFQRGEDGIQGRRQVIQA